nr:MAG TPA: hypothetical protein [Caudoviricetes sp.]
MLSSIIICGSPCKTIDLGVNKIFCFGNNNVRTYIDACFLSAISFSFIIVINI